MLRHIPKKIRNQALVLSLLVSIVSGCTTSRTLTINTVPPGATISINGNTMGPSPVQTKVSWPKKDSTVDVMAQQDGFEVGTKSLAINDAKAAPDPWAINFNLAPIVFTHDIFINCSVEEAHIRINGKELSARTPAKVELKFVRKDGQSPWSTATIDVAKEQYEYRPEIGPPLRFYTTTFDPSHLPPNDTLFVNLQPVEYYEGVITRFDISDEGIRPESETVLSQVGEIEREPRASAVTLVSDLPSNQPLIETKLAVTPDGAVVYSMPVWVPGYKDPKGANLWMQRGVEKIQLTDGNYFDVTPSVSSDGKWIYFSSNRSGKLGLWRIQVNGKGGIGQITDSPSSKVDYEPVLSPDGKHLAYSSLRNGSKVPQIWFCNPDGTLQTQIREGREPAWSPDSSELAYIAPDITTKRFDIWLIDADGSNPRCIASNPNCDFHHPVWTPDGHSIVYDADAAMNSMQKANYDIWMMNADGTSQTQLTVNGSYDADPSVTYDGHSVYFLSNRGVVEEMQNNLQIWKMDLLANK